MNNNTTAMVNNKKHEAWHKEKQKDTIDILVMSPRITPFKVLGKTARQDCQAM